MSGVHREAPAALGVQTHLRSWGDPGLGPLMKDHVDGEVDAVPVVTMEGAGAQRGGCKDNLKT